MTDRGAGAAIERDAPAKLNLFLEVLRRRPDGYHDLDAVFAAIDLADRVRVEPAAGIELTVDGPAAAGVPADARNLCWRAAEALGVGARIRLHKRIPAMGGLGGGSSDAAAVLLALDDLYGLGLGREGLQEPARRLGADVPFFLHGGTARCRGVGDRVEPCPGGVGRRFLLVLPDLGIATADVFRALGTGLTGSRQDATVFLRRYIGKEPEDRSDAPFFNRLQATAETLEPRLREVRSEAERRCGAAFTLTGSGSSYFAPWRAAPPPVRDFRTPGGVRATVRGVATL